MEAYQEQYLAITREIAELSDLYRGNAPDSADAVREYREAEARVSADLGWMMTFCSSDPLKAACSEIDARVAGMDPEAMLKEITALLTDLKNGTDLPETEGKTKPVVGMINELHKGLKALDAGAAT